jgi:hypothetical protein
VHNQILITLSSLILETSLPDVAADVAELPGHLENLQVIHQSKGALRLFLGFFNNVEGFVVIQVL